MYHSSTSKYSIYKGICISIALSILLLLSVNVAVQSIFGQVSPSMILPSNKSNLFTSSNPSTSNFAQPPVTVSKSGNTLTIRTTNAIQGSSANLLKSEAMIKKVIVTDISNAVLIAKGSVTSNVSVGVNAKVVNQLASNRVSTTQGLDFTKKLVAAELANAINAANSNSAVAHTITIAQQQQQIPKVVVDDQAICSGVSSSTSVNCDFTITIHK